MMSSTLPAALSTPSRQSVPSSKHTRGLGAISCSHPKQNAKLRHSLCVNSKSYIYGYDRMIRPPGWCHPLGQNYPKLSRRVEGDERRSRQVAATAGSGSYWVTVAQAFGVAFGFAGMGVIAGFLINYNLWKEAQEDVSEAFNTSRIRESIWRRAKQALEEYESSGTPLPMSVEEIMATQNAGKIRNRPTRKSEKES